MLKWKNVFLLLVFLSFVFLMFGITIVRFDVLKFVNAVSVGYGKD